jgi:hypothetical protein
MSCESAEDSVGERNDSDEECDSTTFPEEPINDEKYDKGLKFDLKLEDINYTFQDSLCIRVHYNSLRCGKF